MARAVETIMEDMSRNRSALAARVEAVRANERLTHQGKSETLAEAYKEAMTRHNALKAELAQARESTLALARGRAFGMRDVSPAGEQNYRSALAQARAVAEDRHKLGELLEQAAATHDYTLLRAVAYVAHSGKDMQLVAAAGEHDRDIAALVDLEASIGEAQTPGQRLAFSAATTAPPRPPEVSYTVANSVV